MLRLVRSFHRHAEVIGLVLGEFGQFHADLFQVQACDFFVELLGQDVDLRLVGILVRPQVDLGQRLVGEAVAHHEARVAGGAAEVDEAAFGQQEHGVAVGHQVFVDLRLDVDHLHAGQCL